MKVELDEDPGMKRSSSGRCVCTLLVGLSLWLPAHLAAQAQGQVRGFVAPINDDSPSHQVEKRVLNERIAELKQKIKAISWDFDQAEYLLKNTALLDGGSGTLALTADYIYGKSSLPITGRSQASDEPKYRAETALADLLKRTLFDPARGPYGVLRVEKCTPPGKDEEVYFLTVKSPSRLRLDDGLAYELGRLKEGGETPGLNIFFQPENIRHESNGSTQFQVNVKDFRPLGKAQPLDICNSIAAKDSAILLLVRYSIPRPAEGSNHGNAQRP